MIPEALRALYRRTFHPQRAPIPPSVRAAVLARDGFRCRDCHRALEWHTAQMGHSVPWSAGGTDDVENLYATCKTCNYRRGAYVPLLHRAKRAAQWTIALTLVGVMAGLALSAVVYGPGAVTAAARAVVVSGVMGGGR